MERFVKRMPRNPDNDFALHGLIVKQFVKPFCPCRSQSARILWNASIRSVVGALATSINCRTLKAFFNVGV